MIAQSSYFIPLRREEPRGEEFANAKLLIRGGFVDKLSAGVFTILPLGLRVLRRIEGIIREQMQNLGAHELAMPALQLPKLWEETGRWESLRPEMFQFRDREDHAVGLAMTHEEVVFDIVRRNVHSVHDLPLALYQFQTKFRDEPRPKSGLIRGREFLMKDLYSFHASRDDLEEYYLRVAEAYGRIFHRCGLRAIMVEASGGVFTKNPSHEFQVVAEAGEDRIFLCERCDFAQNVELKEDLTACPSCGGALRKERSVEVGNIFRFYEKYAEEMGGFVQGAHGEKLPILLASYGIGLGRLMATIVEVSHDEKGIVWPPSVAPFDAHVLALGSTHAVFSEAEAVARSLQKAGITVLYDDRTDTSPGEKLATADLLGIPFRIVVSEKTIAREGVELKERHSDSPRIVDAKTLIDLLKASLGSGISSS
jgi:prolyl-tRNA synthetase